MRTLSSSILLIFVVILLSACSKKKSEPRISRKTPNRHTHSASSERSVELASGAKRTSEKNTNTPKNVSDAGFSSPALLLDDGNALLCSDDGWVFLLNSSNGAVINAMKTKYPMDGYPVVFDGRLFIGDSEGIFRSLELPISKSNRSLKNNNKINSPNSLEKTTKNISPFLPSALNWSFKTEGKIVGGCAVTMKYSGIAGARIVFGSYDTNIYCLAASTGKLKWKLKTGNFINGSPRLLNGEICVGGCDGKLRFIAPKTGEVTSVIDMGSYIPSSPAVSENRCVVSLYTGEIVCVDAESHKVAWRWKTKKKGNRLNFTTSPLIFGDRVLAVSSKGACVAISQQTGKLLWSTTLPNSIEAAPKILPEVGCLVVIDSDGTARLIDLARGGEVAKFATGEPISAPPIALGKRKFLLASENGVVSAFKTTRFQGRKPRVSRLWSLRPHSVWRAKHPESSRKP